MTHKRIWQLPKSGYTLAEMLIVVTIMIMLVAIALPSVKRVMEDSGTREASRQLNAYFAMAKSRAVQTGRPCGIFMVCDPPLGGAPTNTPPQWPLRQVTTMFLAEIPPPYSGGTVGARGRIMPHLSVPNTFCFYPLYYNGASYQLDTTERDLIWSLIAPGEEFAIRFEYKGPWFVCVRDLSTGELVYDSPSRTGMTTAGLTSPIPPGMNNSSTALPGYTYQIVRMPRRIGNPLEMPPGTCIDLAYSGMGPSNAGFYYNNFGLSIPASMANVQSLAIMFSPDGNIDSMYVASKTDMLKFVPPTTVHFLVGKIEKVNNPQGASTTTAAGFNMYDPESSNLADPLSLWVSVARTSGLVITSENQPPIVDMNSLSATNIILNAGTPQQRAPYSPTDETFALITGNTSTYLTFCRQLATNREQMGGR
jgi:hypothetical protein